MTPKPPGPLVLVRWRDAASAGHKWQDLEWARKYKTVEVLSAGWIVRDDRRTLTMVGAYVEPDGGVGDVQAIPRYCVISIKRLRS